jgi:hypothetical protein
MNEYFGTSPQKGRGKSEASIALIKAMHDIAEECQPITGRGIGYKLFAAGLIPDMSKQSMKRVYTQLKDARELGLIPWEWIVDETRSIEKVPSWSNPEGFARSAIRCYRRDYWDQQPVRVEVWSEKGTVRGVLRPVLDKYGIGFQVMHGFSGATTIYDTAQTKDGRRLMVLYCGDYDPSGMWMSERDLPARFEKYGGDHIIMARIALCKRDLEGLPSFDASEKRKDPRYKWFVERYGDRCWELDAMDPTDLRERVDENIRSMIYDRAAWERCSAVEKAEQESLVSVLKAWTQPDS